MAHRGVNNCIRWPCTTFIVSVWRYRGALDAERHNCEDIRPDSSLHGIYPYVAELVLQLRVNLEEQIHLPPTL